MAENQASFLVSLRDDVSGPARRMRAAIKALRGEVGSMKRDAAGRFVRVKGTGLASMGESIRGMHKSWEKLQKSPAFGAISSGVTAIGTGLVVASAAAGVAAAAIGYTAVKFADFAQRSELGFQAVAKGANAAGMSAEQMFSRAREEAERFGLDVVDTTNQFKGFMVQGANPAMATNLIRMGADLGALGASSEQVKSTFLAINKIMSQGKIQGDEMMILAEAGLNTSEAYKQMGLAAGKSVDEIRKMQQAGTLTSDIALPGIIAAVTAMSGGKQAGDAGKKLAESTLGGMAGKLKAGFQNMFIDISKDASPEMMATFGAMSNELSALFKDQDVRAGILGAIQGISSLVREAIPFVKEFVAGFSNGFKEAWPAMEGFLGFMFQGTGNTKDWMQAISSWGRTAGKVFAAVSAIVGVLGGVIGETFRLASTVIEVATYSVQGLVSAIGAGIFAVSDFFADIAAKWASFDFGLLAGNLINGLINGINDGVQWVVHAVVNLGQTVLGALNGIFDNHSPSKETEWSGQMLGQGIEVGFIKSMRAANNNIGRAASDIVPAIDGQIGASLASAPGMPGMPGGTGGIYQENHFSIVIHQQPGQSAQELGDEIERRMRRMVDARLEELAIEAA